jgi:hypothetical protein
LFILAIVWVYNIIWFLPLDFIKFGLQASFDRDLHAVKPFNALQRRRISVKLPENAIVPIETPSPIVNARRKLDRQITRQMTQQISRQMTRQISRQMSKEGGVDEDRVEEQSGSIITTLEQLTQTGASFYAPYTDTLSALRRQNPLLRSMSTT